ncbi:MAG: ABC transporter permease subunit [Pseudomonadota bacterium]
MNTEDDINKPFVQFAGPNGDYYAETFLKIQKAVLSRWHVNWGAAAGSFIWAAMRGNWLLFWISFLIDLAAVVNLALYYKYSKALVTFADKDYLVARYTDWGQSSIIAAITIFVLGRLFFGWLADRIYMRQYARWRVDQVTPSGMNASRLLIVALITALIVPLLLYRTSQFAPDTRTCIKQDRAMQKGESFSFKDRFDCLVISEFPTLLYLTRPDDLTFPRDDDGNRVMVRKPIGENAPKVNLNAYTSQVIDEGIEYLQVFYAWVFNGVRGFLFGMLSAIEAVFVGTPWPITMGALLVIAYKMAGTRVAIFVGASLIYLAMFNFWQTAMDTMSLVIAATIICVVFGLPLGVWVGKSKRGQAIVTPILDVMQTIPSFVYLLPAVAFFSIGKPPGILATVIFAMPPMVRLTALGIRHVPESTKEAALAFGANPRQLLYKVELPLALPSIMAGVNQVVMMCLSMVVIAALIGAKGMGGIVTEALTNVEIGRGVLAGLGIALLAMMIDRVVQKANKVRN